jgi:hypothetical protein
MNDYSEKSNFNPYMVSDTENFEGSLKKQANIIIQIELR